MIDDLTKIIPPPSQPIHLGRYADVRKIQNAIGLELPDDYVDMACLYGSGYIEPMRTTFLNPFDPDYLRGQAHRCCPAVRSSLEMMEIIGLDEISDAHLPRATYPVKGGILPILADDSGHLCYITSPEQGQWPLIAVSHGSAYEIYDEELCRFLVRVFRQEAECLHWNFDNDVPPLSFVPCPLQTLCCPE